MNHISQIAAGLPEYGLDAMLITSESGERYALGFHGEGMLLVTREGAHDTTAGRYIEAAQEQITGARSLWRLRKTAIWRKPGPIWRSTGCIMWALRAA